MKIEQFLILVCLSSAPAYAGEADLASESTALDLSLPQTQVASRNGPPGARYEDFQREADASAPNGSLCPISPSGESREITGSMTTGMGYSRGGNSTFGAATINYCKEHVREDGDTSLINVSISVGQYDGPDGYGGYRTRAKPRRYTPGKAER